MQLRWGVYVPFGFVVFLLFMRDACIATLRGLLLLLLEIPAPLCFTFWQSVTGVLACGALPRHEWWSRLRCPLLIVMTRNVSLCARGVALPSLMLSVPLSCISVWPVRHLFVHEVLHYFFRCSRLRYPVHYHDPWDTSLYEGSDFGLCVESACALVPLPRYVCQK